MSGSGSTGFTCSGFGRTGSGLGRICGVETGAEVIRLTMIGIAVAMTARVGGWLRMAVITTACSASAKTSPARRGPGSLPYCVFIRSMP